MLRLGPACIVGRMLYRRHGCRHRRADRVRPATLALPALEMAPSTRRLPGAAPCEGWPGLPARLGKPRQRDRGAGTPASGPHPPPSPRRGALRRAVGQLARG
jgi:hypothetical protein